MGILEINMNLLEQIQSAYERDRQRAAAPLRLDELPLSYEAITPEWLDHAICRTIPGASVLSLRLSAPDNGSSNRRILYLQYNEPGVRANLPRALFCKASHDLPNRITLGISGAAHCETLFYARIRSDLQIEAPHCWFAAFDPDSFNSLIMLDDLSGSGAQFCDHRTVVTETRARSQMDLLAGFHGACFHNAKLREAISELPTWPEYFGRTLAMGMREGSNQGFLAAEAVIPPRLYRRYPEVWAATAASVNRHRQLPHTMAHGDVHLKNWYIVGSGAGSGAMGLGDWQCCSRGHWGRDFAYTVATALPVENRRAWERELLRYYLERLKEAGGPVLPFEDALTIYRQQLMSALTWWTITLTPAPGMPDMQPRDTTLEFIKRISTAIDDLDSLDSFG